MQSNFVGLLSKNGRAVELVQSVKKSFRQFFQAPTGRTVKIRYREECKNIIELVGSELVEEIWTG